MADTYSIGPQVSHEEINPAGNGFHLIWEVPYTVTSGPAEGTSGVLKVQDKDHNAKYVDDAIRAKIASLQEIAALGGGKTS